MGLKKGLELGVWSLVGFGRRLDDSKVSRLKKWVCWVLEERKKGQNVEQVWAWIRVSFSNVLVYLYKWWIKSFKAMVIVAKPWKLWHLLIFSKWFHNLGNFFLVCVVYFHLLLQTLWNHANHGHHFVSSISQFGKLSSSCVCVCGLFPNFCCKP